MAQTRSHWFPGQTFCYLRHLLWTSAPMNSPQGSKWTQTVSLTCLSCMHFHMMGLESESCKGPMLTQVQWIEGSGSRPPQGHMKGSSRQCWKLWTEYPRLAVKLGLLCRTMKSSRTGGDMCQVPSALVADVLQHLHGGPASAQFSAERVWERARQTFYWPSMFKDIQQWCEQCVSCQTRRAPATQA